MMAAWQRDPACCRYRCRYPGAGRIGALLWTVLATGACSSGETAVVDSEDACGVPQVLGQLPEPLAEASGIARDPRNPDLFWLHNDSGNDPLLFAVDGTGALVNRVWVAGTENVDVEDIALARCDDEWCLYLADIGDNGAVRPHVQVHRLPLPATAAGGSLPVGESTVTPEATYTLTYPDGARDAESLVVDHRRGELLIVSKGRDGNISLYGVPLAVLNSDSGPATLGRIGSLAVPIGESTTQYITAADLSPDGRTMAVRSYSTLFLFAWDGGGAFDTTQTPSAASLVGLLEPQGEGLAFAGDGDWLYLASEARDGRPPQLSRILCRAE
jgi:hypothetical protein